MSLRQYYDKKLGYKTTKSMVYKKSYFFIVTKKKVKMAEFKKRKRQNGSIRYTASIRIKGYPPVTKTFDRLTDAKEWAQKTETEIHENINFPKRKAQKYTIKHIIDLFIKNELPKKKPKAQTEFKMVLNWWVKEIGDYYLTSLTTETLVNCRNKLTHKHKEIPIKGQAPRETEETLAPSTINKYLTYMRVVFQYCVEDLDILDINPMAKVKKLKVDNARKRCLTQKEINKLLDACKNTNNELYLCVLIALLTGARKGEVLHLTWGTVDFQHKMLYFLNTKNGDDRGEPMHEFLCNELLKYKNQNKVRLMQNDYIFKNDEGKPKETLIGKLFPKVVKKCGISDFRFHDLRHTQASWQAMGGISQAITQKTLGHRTPAMTARYSHLRNESLRPYLNKVGDTMLEDFLKDRQA